MLYLEILQCDNSIWKFELIGFCFFIIICIFSNSTFLKPRKKKMFCIWMDGLVDYECKVCFCFCFVLFFSPTPNLVQLIKTGRGEKWNGTLVLMHEVYAMFPRTTVISEVHIAYNIITITSIMYTEHCHILTWNSW